MMSMTLPRSPKLTPHSRRARSTSSPKSKVPGTVEIPGIVTQKNDFDNMDLENRPPVPSYTVENPKIGPTAQHSSTTSTSTSTPGNKKNAMDLMDSFAFPFTPELPRKALTAAQAPLISAIQLQATPESEADNATATAFRRETFVVDDESQVSNLLLDVEEESFCIRLSFKINEK